MSLEMLVICVESQVGRCMFVDFEKTINKITMLNVLSKCDVVTGNLELFDTCFVLIVLCVRSYCYKNLFIDFISFKQ